jgi:hypothetical protein
MGNSVSKRFGQAVQEVVKTSGGGATTANAAIKSTAANPGHFLRGEGPQFKKDAQQELFLQRMHKVDKDDVNKTREMPADLLKFIEDVGPLKRSIDEELTSPRLLEEEGREELNKLESTRKTKRERMKMPLMGSDADWTITRNTNFLHRPESQTKDFGTTNIQLYNLLRQKSAHKDMDSIVDSFYKEHMPVGEEWTDQERQDHRRKLKDALIFLELPVLLKDSESNLIGVYPCRVPGQEVKAVQTISDSKVKLVLKDVFDRKQEMEGRTKASIQRSRVRRSSKG